MNGFNFGNHLLPRLHRAPVSPRGQFVQFWTQRLQPGDDGLTARIGQPDHAIQSVNDGLFQLTGWFDIARFQTGAQLRQFFFDRGELLVAQFNLLVHAFAQLDKQSRQFIGRRGLVRLVLAHFPLFAKTLRLALVNASFGCEQGAHIPR